MSVSKWAYQPDKCDGNVCPGDCDSCGKADADVDDCVKRAAAIAVIYGQHVGGKEACENARPNTYGADLREIVAEIEAIPAADVRENKRGTWKRVVDFTGVEAFGYKETTLVGYGCNVCGYEVDVSEGDYNFCPNCGADMRGNQP